MPAAMPETPVGSRILAHLAALPEDAVFERTLDGIALAAGRSRQYVGRVLARRLVPHGYVRRVRLDPAKAPGGGPHTRAGTWRYFVTARGSQAAARAHPPPAPPPPGIGPYGWRFTDPAATAAAVEEHRGQFAKAERLYRRALQVPGPAEREAWIRTRLAGVRYAVCDYGGALSLLSEAERRLRGRSPLLWADALLVRGVVYNDLFRTTEARHVLRQALRVYREQGDVLGEGVAVHNLGYTDGNEERPARMMAGFREALARFEQVGDKEWIAFEKWTIALHLTHVGRAVEAAPLADSAVAVSREIKDTLAEGQALAIQAYVHHALGDRAAARAGFAESLRLFLRLRNRRGVAETLVALAKLAAEDRDTRRAFTLLDRLLVLASHPEFVPTVRWVEIGTRR